jgi:hypothetical protein
MSGGGGGAVIIRPLLASGKLTPKEKAQVETIQSRMQADTICIPKDAEALARICKAVSQRA